MIAAQSGGENVHMPIIDCGHRRDYLGDFWRGAAWPQMSHNPKPLPTVAQF